VNKILTTVEDEAGKEYIQNHHFLFIHTIPGLEIYTRTGCLLQ